MLHFCLLFLNLFIIAIITAPPQFNTVRKCSRHRKVIHLIRSYLNTHIYEMFSEQHTVESGNYCRMISGWSSISFGSLK